MQISFDKVADVLSLQFSREKVKDSEEIKEGIAIDYWKHDNIIGIEILNYSQRKINLNEIVQMDVDEIISMIAQWL